jgi:hypothetical protein
VSVTYRCFKCGTLLAPHDVPCPHCGSNLRNITGAVNEIVSIEEAGRIMKDWFVELTEWIHTLTKIVITSAGILMNYYFESVQSNLISSSLFGLDLLLNNTQFRIARRQEIEF